MSSTEPPPEATRRIQKKLLAWYARSRRDLPWRRTRDPYAVWLSEVMLQQTRVETVVPYYERFLAAYPTVMALAEAPRAEVMRLWSGLGYYRRARLLHDAAQDVARERGGRLPTSAKELATVKGIGPYTAGAVASIAWGEAVPVVDGNVARVLCRLFALHVLPGSSAGKKRLWALAGALVVRSDPSAWNQALMELGATTCTPRSPRCDACPVRGECAGRARGEVERLPPRAVKRAAPTVRRVGLVVRSHGELLLGRRREGGLFGGMWEPPILDEDVGAAVVATAGEHVKYRATVRHLLTHRRIVMRVYSGPAPRALLRTLRAMTREYDILSWAKDGEVASRGLSSLAIKALAAGEGREGPPAGAPSPGLEPIAGKERPVHSGSE